MKGSIKWIIALMISFAFFHYFAIPFVGALSKAVVAELNAPPRVQPTPSFQELAAQENPIEDTNGDVIPQLTGYTYTFPKGTISWQSIIVSEVVYEGAGNYRVAYTEVKTIYLCQMQGDPTYVSRTCQPVISQDKGE